MGIEEKRPLSPLIEKMHRDRFPGAIPERVLFSAPITNP